MLVYFAVEVWLPNCYIFVTSKQKDEKSTSPVSSTKGTPWKTASGKLIVKTRLCRHIYLPPESNKKKCKRKQRTNTCMYNDKSFILLLIAINWHLAWWQWLNSGELWKSCYMIWENTDCPVVLKTSNNMWWTSDLLAM